MSDIFRIFVTQKEIVIRIFTIKTPRRWAKRQTYMREYDVTPEQQGTDCRYQSECKYYQYGIWCNCCNQYESIDDAFFDED